MLASAKEKQQQCQEQCIDHIPYYLLNRIKHLLDRKTLLYLLMLLLSVNCFIVPPYGAIPLKQT